MQIDLTGAQDCWHTSTGSRYYGMFKLIGAEQIQIITLLPPCLTEGGNTFTDLVSSILDTF